MATSLATIQARLELAETKLDDLIVSGNAIAEYREADGRFVRRDLDALRRYVDELRAQASRRTGSRVVRARFARAL